ncbi:hypothetical protein R3P38DRAFT_3570418 [Favolaschia claudopus]|uniref:Uncharacterized protein n=1 Tax=Favolaschia claudopus TaxID=2862362 RepID=A0AAW0ARZ8_9AGAR
MSGWHIRRGHDLRVAKSNGWYDPDILLQALVFRWVFIPWLQRELDAYRDRVNNTAKRADRNKVLPHGVPNHMYEAPEDYGVLDFKIKVDPAAVSYVRNLYAPPDHEVFELVPKDFAELANHFYEEIGSPAISRSNVWEVYNQLLGRFEHLDNLHRIPADIDDCWGYALTIAREDHADDIALLPNLTPLANGLDAVREDGSLIFYLGGVNNGLGLDETQSSQLDEMMNTDEPLPPGLIDLEEGDQLMVVFSDEEEDSGVEDD